MNFRQKKNIKVLSAAVVLAVLLISSVVSYYYYESEGESLRYQYLLNNRHSNQIDYVDRKVVDLLNNVEESLHLMAHSTAMKEYLQQDSQSNRQSLNNLFSIVAINQSLYTQMRIIDEHGHEQVRVRHTAKGRKVIAPSALQDKSQRDYFRFSKELKQDEVGYWGVDLEMADDEFVQPYQPTIRAITPIYSGEARRGYLVVNIDVHEFIESLDFSFFYGYHLSFVNQQGEYFGSIFQDQFSFGQAVSDNQAYSISQQFPALWQQMTSNDRGYWVHQGRFYNYFSTQHFPGLQQLADYILMVSPSNELKKKLSDNALYVLFCSVILVVTTFIFFVRLINRYETDNMERKLIHATINGVAGLVVVDKQGLVTKTNHRFNRMFGFSDEQVIGLNLHSVGLEVDADKLISVFSAARESQYWVGELEGKSKLGGWLVVSAKCEAFLNSVGDVDSYVITFTDISKRKVLESKLRKLGDTDSLTGCWNRRKFDQEIEKEVNLVNRYSDYQSSLAIVDIDHFKRVNDSLGHQEGDRILQRFAFLLRSMCRDTDTIARIGGEEFAFIMPKTEPLQAMQALHRLKAELRETKDLNITFSAGVSEIKQSAQKSYQAADSMLYKAKQQGRDQVLLWERPYQNIDVMRQAESVRK